MSNKPVLLNLGCGRDIMKGWINIDCSNLEGIDVVADLDNCSHQKLPFEDNSVDGFYASHLLEHLKNPLQFMEELYRMAKPDAEALIRVPYGSSDDAYEDPTHVRQYFKDSFGYFSQPFYWRADYGYRGDWQPQRITLKVDKSRFSNKIDKEVLYDIDTYRNIVDEMFAELKAVKPSRPAMKEHQKRPVIVIERI